MIHPVSRARWIPPLEVSWSQGSEEQARAAPVVVTWSLRGRYRTWRYVTGDLHGFFWDWDFFWDIQHLFHILKHGLPFWNGWLWMTQAKKKANSIKWPFWIEWEKVYGLTHYFLELHNLPSFLVGLLQFEIWSLNQVNSTSIILRPWANLSHLKSMNPYESSKMVTSFWSVRISLLKLL